MAKEMEERPSAIVFWFEASEPSTTLYLTNITVGPDLMTAENLDTYLDQEYASGLQRVHRCQSKGNSLLEIMKLGGFYLKPI